MGLGSEVIMSEEVLSLEMVVALALSAEDVALEHSLVSCPVLPQKRQRCCLKGHLCSSLVSLLSLLSLEERSNDLFGELEVFRV